MSKDIQIEHVTIDTVRTIVVGGVKYPRTQWNLGVIAEYETTHNEAVLNKLSDYSFTI